MHQSNPPTSITVDGTIVNGQLQLDHSSPLPADGRVRVTVHTLPPEALIDPDAPDPLDAVIGIGEGPTDGAEQHDHYIYGWPKK